MIAKSPCEHCGVNIEFETGDYMSGCPVVCPECGNETLLELPQPPKPKAMSAELECFCRQCGGHVAFPSDVVGKTAQCPHCHATIILYDAAQSKHSIAYCLSKTPKLGDAEYVLYLAPGDVRHLQVSNFIKFGVEQWISYFKEISLAPEIQGPFGGEDADLIFVMPEDFVPEPSWEDTLKVLHSFAMLYRSHGVPGIVYEHFHNRLKLQSLEFAECIDSWVKEAWQDYFIAQSYAKSVQYILITIGDASNGPEQVRYAVFKKTTFVIQRLDEVAKLEEDAKAAENWESLRRSNFKIFVYLMEDLRNGLFKIGQSQTPEKREKTLQSEVPETSLRFYIPAHDTAEQELHELFSTKRMRGEWFKLTSQDILSIVEFLKQKGDLTRHSVDYAWLGKMTLGISGQASPTSKSTDAAPFE